MIVKKQNFIICILLSMILVSCEKKTETPMSGVVVINEIMALNTSTVADQDGEFDDWIELYNTSGEAVDISGYFLSDDDNNTTKWKIPQGTSITGKGFIIIWADSDLKQSGLHADFKLSADGEEVILSFPDDTQTDRIEYPANALEQSYARVPDGTGDFYWKSPTFGMTNGTKK
jgi:hypothetical protein